MAAFYKNSGGRSSTTDYGVIVQTEDSDGEVKIRFDGGTTRETTQYIPVQWVQRRLGIPERGDHVSARYKESGGNVSNEAVRARVIGDVDSDFEVRVSFHADGITQTIPCEWIHSF